MNRRLRERSGFTLIEVLVALAIFGISLAVLLHVFSDSLSRARESKYEMAASAIAQSLLADVGPSMPLTLGDIEGETVDGFSWRLHIEPYGTADDHKAWSMDALSLTVSVSWKDGSKTHAMTLHTVRTMSREQSP
jgi:type II secretion system protein I